MIKNIMAMAVGVTLMFLGLGLLEIRNWIGIISLIAGAVFFIVGMFCDDYKIKERKSVRKK